jgi:hypothetical protein
MRKFATSSKRNSASVLHVPGSHVLFVSVGAARVAKTTSKALAALDATIGLGTTAELSVCHPENVATFADIG